MKRATRDWLKKAEADYLALLNGRDPAHTRALAESRIPRQIVTSEFTLLKFR